MLWFTQTYTFFLTICLLSFYIRGTFNWIFVPIISAAEKNENAGTKNSSLGIPKKRQELMHWNGWGFKDSGFIIHDSGSKKKSQPSLSFAGTRYAIGAGMELPCAFQWANDVLGIEGHEKISPNREPTNYPAPIIHQGNIIRQFPTHSFRFINNIYNQLRFHWRH